MATEVTCIACGRKLGGRRILYFVCPKDDHVEVLCRTCRDQFREVMGRLEQIPGYDARFATKLSNPPMVRGES